MTQVTIGGGRVVCEMDEAAQDEYKQVVGWLQKAIAERDAARAEAAALRKTLREVLDILKSGRSTGRKAIQALYAAEDVLMLALGK